MSSKKQTATSGPRERASVPAPFRPTGPAEYRVTRPWPGVHGGQTVEMRPDRARRLLKAGFVEVPNA